MSAVMKPSWSQARQVSKLLQTIPGRCKRRPREIKKNNSIVIVNGNGKVIAYAACLAVDRRVMLDCYIFIESEDRIKIKQRLIYNLHGHFEPDKAADNGTTCLGTEYAIY